MPFLRYLRQFFRRSSNIEQRPGYQKYIRQHIHLRCLPPMSVTSPGSPSSGTLAPFFQYIKSPSSIPAISTSLSFTAIAPPLVLPSVPLGAVTNSPFCQYTRDVTEPDSFFSPPTCTSPSHT